MISIGSVQNRSLSGVLSVFHQPWKGPVEHSDYGEARRRAIAADQRAANAYLGFEPKE